MKRVLTALLLALLLPWAHAQAPAAPTPAPPTPAANEEEAPDVQPKFIWGAIIIKYIAGKAFSMFSEWLVGKITDRMGLKPAAATSGTGMGGAAMSVAMLAVDHLRRKGDTSGGAFIVRNPTEAPVGDLKEAPPIAIAQPVTPIKTEEGAENYQGVHIAIVGADRSGNITELRPVRAGFRTGERFKLRAVSTFAGLLVIENINPKGERRQIYPADRGAVVMLQAGADTLLPLGRDEFFEFARTTGEEQLVISLRDPRAIGDGASREKVYRKDEEYGSHFLQEVSKSTYPVISESIRLEHH